MKHPNYPWRNIRHAELLKQAGFELDMSWMNLNKGKTIAKPDKSNVAKLIYWKNKQGISVTFFDYELVTVERLVNKCVSNAVYKTKQMANIVFTGDVIGGFQE